MAKVTVVIELDRLSPVQNAEVVKEITDKTPSPELGNEEPLWFPFGDNQISIDEAWLKKDPTDDSFYLFEFVSVTE